MVSARTRPVRNTFASAALASKASLTRCQLGWDAARRVSQESIYRDVSMPSRNVFDASMFHRLRSDRPIRRPRGKRCWHGRGRIRKMVSIHEWPTQADTRGVAGDVAVAEDSQAARKELGAFAVLVAQEPDRRLGDAQISAACFPPLDTPGCFGRRNAM